MYILQSLPIHKQGLKDRYHLDFFGHLEDFMRGSAIIQRNYTLFQLKNIYIFHFRIILHWILLNIMTAFDRFISL